MEEQGKRLLLAVGLCMVILYVGSLIWKPEAPPPQAPAQQEQPQATPADGSKGGAAEGQPAAEPAKERGPETFAALENPHFSARISSYGGALESVLVKDEQYAVKGEDGSHGPRDLVKTGERPDWYPLQVRFPGSTFDIGPESEWRLEQRQGDRPEVIATWRRPGELEVVKRFRPVPDNYAMEMEVQVTNLSDREIEQRLRIDLFGYQDPNQKQGGFLRYAEPVWSTACLVNGETRSNGVKDLLGGDAKTNTGRVGWGGMVHKFFLLAVAPQPGSQDQIACSKQGVSGNAGVMNTSLTFAAWKLPPGQPVVSKMYVYAGPKSLDYLEAMDRVAGGQTFLPDAVDWGRPPIKWFTFLARPMLSLLKLFHGFLASWGAAIILLTILVKLATLYWTTKSMRSMRAMSKLKPKMDEIKEKYPDDKQRQQVEIMNLYKAYNINPLGGCLPMLLQMPVWMALYSSLYAAAELYQARFLWIPSLTAPDPYYIMPVLLTGTMFLQSKIQPTAVDSAQQKIFKYAMPLMFGVFSLVFPAGLTVYIFTNTVLSIGHQFYLNKTDNSGPGAQKPEPVAKAEPDEAPRAQASTGRPGKKRRRRPSGRKKRASAKA